MFNLNTQWQAVCARKQTQRSSAIPDEWLIDTTVYSGLQNFLHVPDICGLLSNKEIEITSQWDAVDLIKHIRQRKYTVVEVVVAFCKRAAIAQQLVRKQLHGRESRLIRS